jgi:halocyanin-like protein
MKQMIDDGEIDRRTVLRGAGALAVTGMLAGCSGGDSDDGEDGSGDGDVPSEVSDYLSDANNFDGSVADETGSGNVEVEVGAANGLAYGPAAVRIDVGTDINWSWTGSGGSHNVVAEDGAFDSGSTVGGSGNNFQHTFEEAGTYLYYCTPHKQSGMKGAVIVEDSSDDTTA